MLKLSLLTGCLTWAERMSSRFKLRRQFCVCLGQLFTCLSGVQIADAEQWPPSCFKFNESFFAASPPSSSEPGQGGSIGHKHSCRNLSQTACVSWYRLSTASYQAPPTCSAGDGWSLQHANRVWSTSSAVAWKPWARGATAGAMTRSWRQ